MENIIPIENIQSKIYIIRNEKVMFDKDLAKLYEVKPIVLRQQVKRNASRFPNDFMFQLTEAEVEYLVSQFVIPSKNSLGGYNPYVFTEHGILMLSSVLRSERAIQINIQIMRAFVRLREFLSTHEEIKRKLSEHDQMINYLVESVNELLEPPFEESKRRIGFIIS